MANRQRRDADAAEAGFKPALSALTRTARGGRRAQAMRPKKQSANVAAQTMYWWVSNRPAGSRSGGVGFLASETP